MTTTWYIAYSEDLGRGETRLGSKVTDAHPLDWLRERRKSEEHESSRGRTPNRATIVFFAEVPPYEYREELIAWAEDQG